MAQLPIYIINLKRMPERKLYIQRQLDALNLNYQFVEAVDKHDLYSEAGRAGVAGQLDIDKADVEAMRKRCQGLGPLACMLSHLKTHNLMIKNNIPAACVLEDDSYILPTFPKILAAHQEIPWDILMLSSQSSIIAYIGRTFLKAEKLKMLRLLLYAYRLIRYKKYWPQLNPYTYRHTVWCVIKYLFLKCFGSLKLNSPREDIKERATRDETCFAVEIGALPTQDRASWHKITPKHFVANPHIGSIAGEEGPIPISITSCMAYMVKRSAAIKWKQAAIKLSHEVGRKPGYPIHGYASKNLEVDHIPRYLYCNGDINLYVLVAPCIRAEPKYMTYSARIS